MNEKPFDKEAWGARLCVLIDEFKPVGNREDDQFVFDHVLSVASDVMFDIERNVDGASEAMGLVFRALHSRIDFLAKQTEGAQHEQPTDETLAETPQTID